jgi:hypothetical protein
MTAWASTARGQAVLLYRNKLDMFGDRNKTNNNNNKISW